MDRNLLIICQNLAKQGKTPSVALLKAKAPKNFHLSELVSAVQHWKANPELALQEVDEKVDTTQSNQVIEEMSKAELTQRVLQLEERLTMLEQQLGKSK